MSRVKLQEFKTNRNYPKNGIPCSKIVIQEGFSMKDYSDEVRSTIRSRLKDKGDQARLAKAIGIPSSTLSRKLNGKSPITISDLSRIADFLNVSIGSLVPDKLSRFFPESGENIRSSDQYEQKSAQTKKENDEKEIKSKAEQLKEDIDTFIVNNKQLSTGERKFIIEISSQLIKAFQHWYKHLKIPSH